MLKRVQIFERRNGTVIVDTTSGKRVVTYLEPGKKVEDLKEGPSLLRKAANFTKAGVKHIATGRKQSTDKTRLTRLNICKVCSSYKVLEEFPRQLKEAKEVGTCIEKSCGCFIHELPTFPNKLAWASQSCPLKKWGEEKDE